MFGIFKRVAELEDEVVGLQVSFDELIAEFDAALAITTEVLEKLTPKKKRGRPRKTK